MPLIEFKLDESGRIKAIPTKTEYVPNKHDERAARDAELEHMALQAKWDQRRAKFLNWAVQNPRELDLLLDECEKYGVWFEHECND